MDHQDGSMEPSLDASNLGPQDEAVYTQSAFGHASRYVDTYTPDDSMNSFFGLSGPHSSMEDLQQQQRRFGSTSTNMAMGTISEEMEDGHQDMSGFTGHSSMLGHDMNVNLNDSIDPASFEMPSFGPYSSLSQGPHATWGASAATEEYDPFSTRYTTQPPPIMMGSTPTPTLPVAQPISSLPYRPAGSMPAVVTPYTTAEMQAFHQAPPPFFDQPIVPSQNKRPPPALPGVAPFTSQRYNEASINQGPLPISPPERMDSVVRSLPENVSNFRVQTRAAEPQSQKQSGSALSTLTTRKQRRPAPLTTTARSSSFGSTAPSSPRTTSMDANLRRIKSSGNFGGGRVQKLNNSNIQRSPLNLNFNQAELTRTISSQSMTNLAGEMWRRDSQDPMTPASPSASFMGGSSSGPSLSQSRSMSQLRCVPNGHAVGTPHQVPVFGGQTPTFFSHGPLFDGPYLEMSPPETPSHAMSGFHQSPFPAGPFTQDMIPPPVPSSAPAHQQTFFPVHYSQQHGQTSASQNGFPPRQQLHPSQPVPQLNHATPNGTPSQSRHMRTATAQYIGPPQPQFYQHPNESAPGAMGRSNGSAEMLAQSTYGTDHFAFQAQPPNPSGPAQSQRRPVEQSFQHQYHDGQMHDQGQQQQRTSPPGQRPKNRSHTIPVHQEPPRPPSAQPVAQTGQTGQTKVWPYTSRFTPHNTDAFSTWDLNERSTTTVPDPPQERKYSFVQWEGGNGSLTPDKAPKSAGLISNYSKIEFLNTSPQAFMEGSSTSPVPG